MDTVPVSLVFQLMLGTPRKRQQASFRLGRLGLPHSVRSRCKMKGRRARTELDTMMPRLQSLTQPPSPGGETGWATDDDIDSSATLPGDWRKLHDVRELLEETHCASELNGSAQVGILCYRDSRYIESRVIPFPQFARTYQGMQIARKGSVGISTSGGASIAILMDCHAMQQDHISPEWLVFRTTGTSASVGTPYEVGGPYGAIGGTLLTFVFYDSEAGYDLASEWASELAKGIADLKQALRSCR